MSLILGIYSRKKPIHKQKFASIISNFSLQEKRKIKSKIFHKIFLATTETKLQNNNLNEDKHLITLFVGNIDNYEEQLNTLLKKNHQFKNIQNQAKFMHHAYQTYGIKFLKKLRGTFSFIVYHKKEDKLVLCNDSFGLYPLFLYKTSEYIIFCTEYEPIVNHTKFNKKLNHTAIAEYFIYRFTLGNKTFFRDINNLNPGHICTVENNRIFFTQYDKLDIAIKYHEDINYFADKAAYLLKNATQRLAKHQKYLKAELTGGADTRLFLENLTPNQQQRIKFFTRSTPWLSNKQNQEIIIGEMLAKKYKLRYSIEQPRLVDTNTFNTTFFDRNRIIPANNIFISGTGGGEWLGGAVYKHVSQRLNKMNKKHIRNKLDKIFTKTFLQQTQNLHSSLNQEINNIRSENQKLLFGIFQNSRVFFTNYFGGSRAGWLTPYNFILKEKTIFWNEELLRLILSTPVEYLLNRKLFHLIYKKHFANSLKIPTTRKNMNQINVGTPPHIVKKSKHVKALFTTSTNPQTWNQNIFNLNHFLSSLKKTIIQKKIHESQPSFISSFIDFQVWYKKYIQ